MKSIDSLYQLILDFEVDNVAPVVSSITFTEDNIFDSTLSNDSSAYVLAKGDNVELIFSTSEPVDQPSVSLMIGTDNQTITATSSDSQTWKAAYQIKSGDSGFLKWSLSGIDRAGNNLVLGTSEPVEGLEFIAYNQKKYVADTVQPLVQTMTFETDRPSNVFKYGTNDRLIHWKETNLHSNSLLTNNYHTDD